MVLIFFCIYAFVGTQLYLADGFPENADVVYHNYYHTALYREYILHSNDTMQVSFPRVS